VIPGEWTPSSVIAAFILLISIVMGLAAPWRSWLPRDEQPSEYHVALRGFVISSITLLLSLIVAAFSYVHEKG
jgi:hypothetical protein